MLGATGAIDAGGNESGLDMCRRRSKSVASTYYCSSNSSRGGASDEVATMQVAFLIFILNYKKLKKSFSTDDAK
ncbi:hypothetical protein ACLOJK_007677 [Asimina triloba]